jgi:hypothetical protein
MRSAAACCDLLFPACICICESRRRFQAEISVVCIGIIRFKRVTGHSSSPSVSRTSPPALAPHSKQIHATTSATNTTSIACAQRKSHTLTAASPARSAAAYPPRPQSPSAVARMRQPPVPPAAQRTAHQAGTVPRSGGTCRGIGEGGGYLARCIDILDNRDSQRSKLQRYILQHRYFLIARTAITALGQLSDDVVKRAGTRVEHASQFLSFGRRIVCQHIRLEFCPFSRYCQDRFHRLCEILFNT